MSTTITPSEIRTNLGLFSGTETWTKWSPLFRNCLLTDGALYLAENCGAYWLMDAIGSYQHERKFRAEDFQVWKLARDPVDGWRLIAEDGNDNQLASQFIEFSDFPLDEGITIYAIRNELGGLTLMLPSEY